MLGPRQSDTGNPTLVKVLPPLRLARVIWIGSPTEGVSLIDTTVALAVFSLTIGVFFAALSVGVFFTGRIKDEVASSNLAVSQLEDSLSQTYQDLGEYPTVATGGYSLSNDNFVIDPLILQRLTTSISNVDRDLVPLTTHKLNESFEATPPPPSFSSPKGISNGLTTWTP